MSKHHACDHFVLRTPPRPSLKWHVVLNVIVLVLEAFEEAAEMRRAVHRKYPFDNE